MCIAPILPWSSYIFIYFRHKTLFSPNLMIIITGKCRNTKTIWNNPISHVHQLIRCYTPLQRRSVRIMRYTWTSNVCHIHNFHRRDLKFSDVPDTITIFKQLKKMINRITAGMVPLNVQNVVMFPVNQVFWSII